MKRLLIYSLGLIALGLISSCFLLKGPGGLRGPLLGNFTEKRYEFMICFDHLSQVESIVEAPCGIKFGGTHFYNESNYSPYAWLRKNENLELVFETALGIGLDHFVSKERYFQRDSEWCYQTIWQGKSLAMVVKSFVNSDTSATDSGYYAKFWLRRRHEGNLALTYQIFQTIDDFYHDKPFSDATKSLNPLKSLWTLNLQLLDADSLRYQSLAYQYFDIMRAAGLHASAYRWVAFNKEWILDSEERNQLIRSMPHDTIDPKLWYSGLEVWDAWIFPLDYPDPNQYYGP